MRYTCPKCGKKMELSNEVLISSDYKVICPQCLSQLQIVGDYAYIPNDTLELDTTVEQSRTICCPKCGHEANSNAHFCPNCGNSFDTPTVPPPTPAVPGDGVDEVVAEEVTPLPPAPAGSDPLFNEAIRFLGQCRSITPMMLRDRFSISDERALELLRQLEQAGAVGPYNHGGPRQILIPHLQYNHPREANSPNGSGRQGTIGCLSWIFIILAISLLVRMCS